ncbi:MAG: hypothetical protein AAF961_00305 [Planctomycetota bacterium]
MGPLFAATMATRRPWLISALLMCLAQSALSAQLENAALRLTWDDQIGSLTSIDESFAAAANALQFPWPVERVAARDALHARFGAGRSLVLTHKNEWMTTLTLYETSPFLHCETTVVNRSEDPIEVNTLPMLQWRVDLGLPIEQLRMLGTGGLTDVDQAKGSYAFHVVADPASRGGVVAGWLTHRQGVGVFFPISNESVDAKQAKVRSEVQFGRFRVAPKSQRTTETMLLGLFADGRLGVEAYADAVAQNEAIELPEKPGVYCTWYHAGASNQRDLADNTQFAAGELRPFGLSVMQIDDKWQALIPSSQDPPADPKSIPTRGPVKVFAEANPLYPDGMAATATFIREQGMTPGIWFMPFAGNHLNPYFDRSIFAKNDDGTPFEDTAARWSGTCIDLSNPAAEAFVRNRIRRIYDWGYRYFKIDGMHTGIPTPNIYVNTSYKNDDFGAAQLHDPAVTHAEAYRRGLLALREQAPDAFVLGCNVSQNMRSMGPAFGMIDAMRIGPDNGRGAVGRWNHVTLGAWHGTNLYFLNNRVWHNDPDPIYVRSTIPIEKARWMCTWIAVAGAMHSSSEQYATLEDERLDMLKRCLPTHSLAARPVDYLERDKPQIWTVADDRMCLVGLFNWNENESTSINCPLDRLDLDAEPTYVGFDYWGDCFVVNIQDVLEQTVDAGECVSLALRPTADHPLVVSTSRNITQGLIDVASESWNAANRTLSGVSYVVADDPYELRVVIPDTAGWDKATASLQGQNLSPFQREGDPANTMRFRAVPSRTGESHWVIQF